MMSFGVTTGKMVQLGQRNTKVVAALETPHDHDRTTLEVAGMPDYTLSATTSSSPQLCECGCGQPAPIARKSRKQCGHIKGQPVRFISGHNSRYPRVTFEIRPNGCWIWLGSKNGGGYGTLGHRGRNHTVHRFLYELLIGPIPPGLHLDHVKSRGCIGPACVNPAHMEPVTAAVNTQRGKTARLTEDDVRSIRTMYAAGGQSYKAIATRFGVGAACVGEIVRRESWADVE